MAILNGMAKSNSIHGGALVSLAFYIFVIAITAGMFYGAIKFVKWAWYNQTTWPRKSIIFWKNRSVGNS